MDLVAFIGRLHPVVLHLPIGALFTIIVAEMWLFYSRKREEHVLLFVFYLFACATGLLAVITGLILHEEDVYGGATLDLHKQLGIATGVALLLVTGCAYMAIRPYRSPVIKWVKARRVTLMLSLGLITAAGHFGAELTHGKGFLTEFAPAFFRPAPEETLMEVTDETPVFDAAINPIIQNYCVYCHDAENSKGGLRMDSPEAMVAGGSSGPLFIPGNPQESLMIQRIHLPIEHDDHMPPSNKRQPGEEEKAALAWWIENGASFEMKLADSQVPDYVRSLISIPEVKDPVPAPTGDLNLQTVQKLRDQFLTIQRIHQGDNRLWIDFSAVATTADDAFLEQLRPLAGHIVWLNLSRTQITDASMPLIGSMENLEELDLRNCEITDAGLEHLRGLEHLKKLNLTETRASEDSLDVIVDLPSLQVLDLFQSEWSMDGLARLREAHPNLIVNFGE